MAVFFQFSKRPNATSIRPRSTVARCCLRLTMPLVLKKAVNESTKKKVRPPLVIQEFVLTLHLFKRVTDRVFRTRH